MYVNDQLVHEVETSLTVYRQNNEITKAELDMLSSPENAPKTINYLMEKIVVMGNALKAEEARRSSMSGVVRLQKEELQVLERRKKDVEDLMEYNSFTNERIHDVLDALWLVACSSEDESTITLAKALNEYLKGIS